MLSFGKRDRFVFEKSEIVNDSLSGSRRVNDAVDGSSLSCFHRVGELILIVEFLLLEVLSSEDNLAGSLGPHNSDLTRGPRVVDIASDLLCRLHTVGSAIPFPRDDCDPWRRALAVGVKHLGSMLDNPSELLVSARQKARNVF